jgi:hypothetical protein|tara:strand:- start:1364 stop:1864 length:501 start_codon:yes stop_codon:yes gene_type:complete
MTRKQFEGQFREIVVALAAALGAWGVLSDAKLAALSGLLVSLAVLFWGVANKEGGGILASFFRKLIGAGGSVLVVFGVLDPDKAEFLAGAILPIVAMWSSFNSNGETSKFHAGGLPVVFFLALMSLCLPSCVMSLGDDGEIKGQIDWAAVRGGIGAVVNDPVIWEK